MKTRYDSFEEIDQQLKILQLRKSIDREYLLFHTKKLKNTLLPKNWLRTFDSVIQGALISWMLKRLMSKRKKLKN